MSDPAAHLWQQALDPLDPLKLRQAVELDPTPTPHYIQPHQAFNCWHLRASALMQMGRIQGAADCYRQALKQGQDDLELLLESGICLFKVADIQTSLTCLERAIQLYPQDGRGFIYRAEVLLSQDRVTEALDSFQRGLKVGPSAAGFWAQGNAYCTLGRYPEALDSYRQAWRLEPGHTAVRQALIQTLRASLSRHPDAALTEELLQLDPQDNVGRLAAIRVAHQLGHNQGLLAQLDELPVEDHDMRWRIQELRASLLLAEKRWQEAAEGWCRLGDYDSAWPILRGRMAQNLPTGLPPWIDREHFLASLKKSRLLLNAEKQLGFDTHWRDSQKLLANLKLTQDQVEVDQVCFAITLVSRGPVLCAAFSGDGKRVLTVQDQNQAVLWDCAEGRQQGTFQPTSPLEGGPYGRDHTFELYIERAALDRSGERVLLGFNDGSAGLYQSLSGQLLFCFRHLKRTRPTFERVRAVTFSPDEQQVAVGFDQDRTVGIWNAANGELVA